MNFEWYTPELHATVIRARDMALADPDFAKRARENPNAVLKNDLGFDLPVKVKFVQLDKDNFALVRAEDLPEDEDELSDELLELVSAGIPSDCGSSQTHTG